MAYIGEEVAHAGIWVFAPGCVGGFESELPVVVPPELTALTR